MDFKNKFNISKITSSFVSGLLALVPITVGFLILSVVFGWLKGLLGLVVESQNPGVFILLVLSSIILVVLLGMEIQNNKKIDFIAFGEMWISKFPFLGKIIGILKEFTNMVQGRGKFENLGVALVPFGGSKIYALITNQKTNDEDEVIYTCFIVQGTFPPTGLVCFYNQNEVEIVEDMTPADIFQLQVTLGVESSKKK